MKTTYLIALIFTGICLLSHLKAQDDVPQFEGEIQPESSEPLALITVSGSAQVDVEPDQVVVNVQISLRDPDLDALTEQINNRSSTVIEILKDEGVADDAIQNSSVTFQPYYVGNSLSYGSTSPTYYTGQKSITFTLDDVTNYDNTMSRLYGARINHVNSVVFQLSNQLLKEQKREARKKAAANSNQTLSELVDTLGLNIGRPYSVSESTSGGDPQSFYQNNGISNFEGEIAVYWRGCIYCG